MSTGNPELASVAPKENLAKRAFNEVKTRGQGLAEKLRLRRKEIKDDPATPIQDESAEGALKALAEKADDNEPTLPSGKRASWLREGYVTDERGNFHLGIGIESRMSRPGGGNVYGEGRRVNVSVDHFGVSIPKEVEEGARDDFRRRREAGEHVFEDDEYLYFVGDKLGWIYDPKEGWTIPSDQIEKLSSEEYEGLINWGRDKEAE